MLWIDKGMAKKMKKFAFGLPDWFGETESLIKQFVAHQSESTLSLDQQKTAFTHLYEEIKEIAKQVNPTQEKTVMAEHAKQ